MVYTCLYSLIGIDLQPATRVFRNSMNKNGTMATSAQGRVSSEIETKLKNAAQRAVQLIEENQVDALSKQVIQNHDEEDQLKVSTKEASHVDTTEPPMIAKKDCFYSFRSSFSGFVISFVDSVPSEICVVSLRKVDVMAEWNEIRSTDATAVASIGWIQIDNHCQNAPFPVFLSPDNLDLHENTSDYDEQVEEKYLPVLRIGFVFAPRHTSNITCLKGVTIEPRDVFISTDLALIMRLQYFLLGLLEYMDHSENQSNSRISSKAEWAVPDLSSLFQLQTESVTLNTGSRNLYFETFTILPFNIKLSVAPTNALSGAQEVLEGSKAGAIHAAVRKGDVLIGDGAGVLGVKIGSKNRTVLSVVRGIFKSILVDGLLRFDEASMNFNGVLVRNHISTGKQLGTHVGAHYLSSLKSNVPALLGSLAAFGNPVGLIRGFGDGFA
jgi:hypothetical protein